MKFSAILYLVVILSFFMPFFVVSCQQTELVTIKGITLVTGGDAKLLRDSKLPALLDSADKKDQKNKIDAQPYAIAAFVIAILSLILVIVLPAKWYYVPILLSVVGVVCLQLLKSNISNIFSLDKAGLDPSMNISNFIVFSARSGYWIANIGFLLSAISALIAGILLRKQSYDVSNLSVLPENYDHPKPIPPLEPIISHLPAEESELEMDLIKDTEEEESTN